MPRHGAEIRVLLLLGERDDEFRRLARLDQRRLLAVDLEVVHHMADVLENERDFAGLCDRLGREFEEELAAFDLDRGRGCARLPVAVSRRQRHQGESRDRSCREREDRADRERTHLHTSLVDSVVGYGSE
jgi:hypothetical protein